MCPEGDPEQLGQRERRDEPGIGVIGRRLHAAPKAQKGSLKGRRSSSCVQAERV